MNLRLAMINVGTFIGRTTEVGKVDIAALQEVRCRKAVTRLVLGSEFEYKLFLIEDETGRSGVGMMVKKN